MARSRQRFRDRASLYPLGGDMDPDYDVPEDPMDALHCESCQ